MYHVSFSAEAEDAVRNIRDWIAGRSTEGAIRWLEALDETKNRLAHQPEVYPLAPEANAFAEPLRQIVFKTKRGNTYRALFLIRQTDVHIVAVRAAGQNLITPDDLPPAPPANP